MIILFNNLKEKDKSIAIERLISGSTPSQDFFYMILLSILTATFGLLINNSAVIIGSMLIAPILYPILSLSLGIVMSDAKLISRAFYTVIKSMTLGIITSAVTTLLFSSHFSGFNTEIISRTQATLPYLGVAIAAGLAGSFALVKPKLNENLPGIAISVALIPPLAVVGIGVAKFSWTIVSGSLLLFLVNAIGVVFASMITFSMMNFYVKKSEAHKTVQKEDMKEERVREKAEKEIQKEEEK